MRGRATRVLAIAILLGTYLFGKITGDDLAWLFFYSFAALFLLSGAACLLAHWRVQVWREAAPGWLPAGGLITLRLTAKRLLLLLPANLELLDGLPSTLLHLVQDRALVKSGYSRQWEARCRVGPLPRGIYVLDALELKAMDFFGLFTCRRIFDSSKELVVYPVPVQLPSWPRGLRGVRGSTSALYRQPDETVGIRDYAPGDRLHDLHWPATAHSADLKAREFATMAHAGQTRILLDCCRESYQGVQERLEETLRIAAALIYYCQEKGWPTGLVAGSGEGRVQITPASGKGHLARLLRGLAGIDFQEGYSLQRLISGEAARALPGTSLLLVTSEATQDLLSEFINEAGRVSLEVFPARESRPEARPHLAGGSRRLIIHPPVFPEGSETAGKTWRGGRQACRGLGG